jgi:hypothetical protein
MQKNQRYGEACEVLNLYDENVLEISGNAHLLLTYDFNSPHPFENLCDAEIH